MEARCRTCWTACARSDGAAGSDVRAGSGTSWKCLTAQNMTSVVVSLGSKHREYSPEHEVARKSERALPAATAAKIRSCSSAPGKTR
jgi:hypothetical protein